MRGVLFYTFFSGVMVGVAMGASHEHRWSLVAYNLGAAVLLTYIAWDRWRKIPKLP